MAKTDYLEQKILNHVLRNIAYTPPVAVYLALFSTATTDAGGGTELTGGGYARQQSTFGAPVGNVCQNSAQVSFPIASGAWSPATYGALFDAASGGNMLYHGPLSAQKTVALGEQLIFPIGTVFASED